MPFSMTVADVEQPTTGLLMADKHTKIATIRQGLLKVHVKALRETMTESQQDKHVYGSDITNGHIYTSYKIRSSKTHKLNSSQI